MGASPKGPRTGSGGSFRGERGRQPGAARFDIPSTAVGDDGMRASLPGDAELVARCRQGDAAAKRELLVRVLPTIRGATRTLLAQRADADDAAQQAMLDLLGGLDGFRGEGSLAGWARVIAVRAALRHAARQRRHASVVDPEPVLEAHPAAEPEDDALLAEGLPRPVEAYLDALPPVQRQALVLRHGLGYTVPEMAELCGESVNTIKSRLVTARKALRKLVRRDEAVAEVRRDRRQGVVP
jgi:RNA polymerase sigma-70 factor, ECF subfamily